MEKVTYQDYVKAIIGNHATPEIKNYIKISIENKNLLQQEKK